VRDDTFLSSPAGVPPTDRRARDMDASLIVVVVVVTALVFDFTNGFHDTANAMATSIATGTRGPGSLWRSPVA